MRTDAGVVREIYRYPVKSMGGEALDAAELDSGGVHGDRAYALVDDDTGLVVSAKRPRRWRRMLELSAAGAAPDVVVQFPDGQRLAITGAGLPGALRAFLGRDVSVVRDVPDGARFEEVWVRDLKDGVDPYFGEETRAEDDDEIIDGGQFMAANGNFADFGAVHLLTTASLAELASAAPGSSFDTARFRPNLVVETAERGFVENEWAGRTLTIGDVELRVSIAAPRCVMTTLAQPDLPADRDVLRTITAANKVEVLPGARYSCLGVYADVLTPGAVPVGAPVTVA